MTAPKSMLVMLDNETTADELRSLMRRFGDLVTGGEVDPIRILVGGYDDETTKEVWFEPAALALFQRIVDTGFLSLMVCDHEPHPEKFSYGIDAIALLACLRGCMHRPLPGGRGAVFVWNEAEHLPSMMEIIGTANAVCDTYLDEVAA